MRLLGRLVNLTKINGGFCLTPAIGIFDLGEVDVEQLGYIS